MTPTTPPATRQSRSYNGKTETRSSWYTRLDKYEMWTFSKRMKPALIDYLRGHHQKSNWIVVHDDSNDSQKNYYVQVPKCIARCVFAFIQGYERALKEADSKGGAA